MSDITKIAEACASRIMDRMEMCRKDRLAILKSDIEREVEVALKEVSDNSLVGETVEALADEQGVGFNDEYIKEFVANFEANNALLTGRMLEQVYDEAREALDVTGIGKALAQPRDYVQVNKEDMKVGPLYRAMTGRDQVEITVEEAEKRGIPIGSAGYVWIA